MVDATGTSSPGCAASGLMILQDADVDDANVVRRLGEKEKGLEMQGISSDIK